MMMVPDRSNVALAGAVLRLTVLHNTCSDRLRDPSKDSLYTTAATVRSVTNSFLPCCCLGVRDSIDCVNVMESPLRRPLVEREWLPWPRRPVCGRRREREAGERRRRGKERGEEGGRREEKKEEREEQKRQHERELLD